MSALNSSPAAARNFLEAQAKTVRERCPDKSLSDIRLDLLYTKDLRTTLDRIFEGEFLHGTSRDPRRPSALSRISANKGPENAIPVIDLSEDTPAKSPSGPAVAKRKLQEGFKGKGKEVSRVGSKSPLFRNSTSDDDLEIIHNGPSPHKSPLVLRSPSGSPAIGTSSQRPSASTPLSTDSTPFTNRRLNPYASSPLRNTSSPTPIPIPITLPKSAIAEIMCKETDYSSSTVARKQVAVQSDGSDIEIVEIIELPSLPKRHSPGSAVSGSDSSSKQDSGPGLSKWPPQPSKSKSKESILDLAGDSSSEDSNSEDDHRPYISKGYSEGLQEILLKAREEKSKKGKRKSKASGAETAASKRRRNASTGDVEGDPLAESKKKSIRPTDEEKAKRAVEREEVREAKKREKEAKDAEKELHKANKKREREAREQEKKREQDLLSANKLRNSKKDSLPEMIADISMSLADTSTGDQLQRFLLELGCKVNATWTPTISGNPRMVKWRRRVKAEFDTNFSMFLPLENEEIRDENHALICLSAKEFTDIALPLPSSTLFTHVQKIKSAFRTPLEKNPVRLIYLLEGLHAFVRKQNNLKNRAYQSRVLSHLPGAPGGGGPVTADDSKAIEEDDIEDALLELQITHNCLIHHTATPAETAEWISIFTGDISTIPYKRSRDILDTSFCTEVGQVKPGLGKRDTYRKMLQEITRITPNISAAIAHEYPDVRALIGAIRQKGDGALAELENSSMRNGLQSSRIVGAACSRRIAGVFTGRDPFWRDV